MKNRHYKSGRYPKNNGNSSDNRGCKKSEYIPRFEIEAKKSLGQNFLKNPTIIAKIADAGLIQKGDIVVEIGPGTGALTKVLLAQVDAQGGTLIAIEKDRRAISVLQDKFASYIEQKTFFLVEGDILEIDLAELISKITANNKPKFKIIANIPYYITGAIIRKSLEMSQKPALLVFLVQKEVAMRIVRRPEWAGSGKNKKIESSLLAESISAYGQAEFMFIVSKGNFVPAPKVDSAVIRIQNISDKAFKDNNLTEKQFFAVLKAGFAHKRKKLINNLADLASNLEPKSGLSGSAKQNDQKIDFKRHLESIFKQLSMPETARAEEISTEKWFAIAKML